MRPEFDSEIDSVLRGHARRGGALPAAWDAAARPSISGGAQSNSHLDADEIAAFGEDALPAAARARYSAHLADCDDCRRSATQVAFAAGVADRINERAGAAAGVAERAEEQARAVAAAAYATPAPSAAAQSPSSATRPPSWRERLSSLFAPRAWRYAMPVVALFALGAVVFVAMNDRLREGASEMARRGGSAARRTSAPATPEAPEAHHADAKQQPGLPVEAQPGYTSTTAGAAPANENSEAAAAGGEVAKPGMIGVESADRSAPIGAASAAGAQTEAAPVKSAETAQQPISESYMTAATPVPVPPPAAASPPRTTIARDGILQSSPSPLPPVAEQDMRERAVTSSRPAAAPHDEAAATKRHGPQRNAAGRSADLSSSAEAMKDDRAPARRARGPATNAANNAANNRSEANRDDAGESKAKREEDREQQQKRAETRTVAGRRFRREGNAWIDTAYRPGQATVVVRRNSEQYRALVADEPGIGSVSRTLGGEVVVVWKGRAYRVRP